jgi:hypothetical protein
VSRLYFKINNLQPSASTVTLDILCCIQTLSVAVGVRFLVCGPQKAARAAMPENEERENNSIDVAGMSTNDLNFHPFTGIESALFFDRNFVVDPIRK